MYMCIYITHIIYIYICCLCSLSRSVHILRTWIADAEVLVRIHFIVVMIGWTGFAPFPFPGSLTSTVPCRWHRPFARSSTIRSPRRPRQV